MTALNARVSKPVHTRFEIAVAHRGIAKQKAVEEALQLWIAQQASLRHRKMGKAPLTRSGKLRSLNLTGQDVDEVLFG